ncbi:MAG: FAD:protein FMN transferase [Lachnospiraceae bacterium]|nr:FAD:protein FMN transferase [Lachnospiraceae bacterium]
MKKYACIAALAGVLIFVVCLFSGCASFRGESAGKEDFEAELEFFAMDTFMRVVACGEKERANAAVLAAQEEVYRLEGMFSTEKETSEIYQANKSGGGEISGETFDLLQRAVQLWEMTGGAFDITVYPHMRAWGFTDGQYRVPDASEISGLLEKTGASGVLFNKEEGSVKYNVEGMQVDLGGIVKGYAAARIMEIYQKEGLSGGLVSLGGNVQVFGTKPDGSPWRIGLKNPEGGKEYLGVLQAKDLAVVTSGGYERYFEQDGARYHHILDPATGYPAGAGLLCATVVSADGTLADGLSTAVFIMGMERAVEFWREHSTEFDMVLYTEEGELYVTEGIYADFSSALPYTIIPVEP